MDSAEYWRRRDYGADVGDMIQDNYGTCSNPNRCFCLAPRAKWLGRGCRWWVPVRSRTFADLRKELGRRG